MKNCKKALVSLEPVKRERIHLINCSVFAWQFVSYAKKYIADRKNEEIYIKDG